MPSDELSQFALWLEGAFIQTARRSYGFRYHLASAVHTITDEPLGLGFSTDLSARHYQLFKSRAFLGDQASPRRRKILNIKARDGEDCFYCGRPLGADMTVEHLLAKSRRGSNKIENLALAHKRCNEKAGALSVAEKIRLRDEMRKQTAITNELNSQPAFWDAYCKTYKLNPNRKNPNLDGYRLFIEEVKAFAALRGLGVRFANGNLLVHDTNKFDEACSIYAKEMQVW